MASTNKSFLESGTKPGLEIWRIENFEAEPLDKKLYGTFYSGDSYLVLETVQTKYGKLKRNLFFWLGSKSTQDEKGTAAYKAVELDDFHKGEPVQYREVEGHESAMFQAAFKTKGGVRVCEGGIDSGFNIVDPNAYTPRLFQCKGKRNVLTSEVPLKSSSLNQGDVFILDCGLTLYRWIGSSANKYEKFKAMQVSDKIKDEERGGKANVIILDSGSDEGKEAEPFWKLLGPKSDVKTASEGGTDSKKKKKPEIVKVSNESGNMEFVNVEVKTKSGKLEKLLLDTDDVFIVDVGYKIFVWVGRGSNKKERKESMGFATKYIESKGYPEYTQVERINERGETPAFKELFFMWTPPRKSGAPSTEAKTEEPKDVAVEELFKVCNQAEEKMVDANGTIQQWRIENLAKVEVKENMKGQFFDGDSYIILYTYMLRNRKAYIIYFWQGAKSSIDEKAGAALLTKDLDDQLQGAPVQVRVTQNHEPKHFMAIFGGTMIIRKGGHASAFKNRNDTDVYDTDGTEMYHIKSTGKLHTRTIQGEETAAALNSGDCFVLLTPGDMFVWYGKGSNKEEQKAANAVSNKLKGSRKVTTFEEGNETEAFWTALGGKKEYATSKLLEDDSREPRMFHLSANTGGLTADEIFNFSQEDLINDDVMMLDLYSEVYVWVGSDCQTHERQAALKIALDYANKNPDGRQQCAVYEIQAGFEPPSFTAHFVGWDPERAGKNVKVDKKDKKANLKRMGSKVITSNDVGDLDPTKNHFSLEYLQGKGLDRIPGSKKEQYLKDDVFEKLFGVTKSEFNSWKKWKQDGAKRKHKLF